MPRIIQLLASNPLLLLFSVIGLGYLVGSARVFGFSLGVSAVLFVGLAFGALDPALALPEYVYVSGCGTGGRRHRHADDHMGLAHNRRPLRRLPRPAALPGQRDGSVRHPPLTNMKRAFYWVVACVVLGVGACALRSSAPASTSGKFLQVLVSIYAFGDARVGAVLIDREGRRTGWNVDRPIRQIPGVLNGYGSDVGITDENAPEDTAQLAPADTVPGHPKPTPVYYYLSIQDSAGTPGLLREGGCELRLVPVAGGRVSLAITGTGAGFSPCQDTTSLTVAPGVATRWCLSWSTNGNKCVVNLSRLTRSRPRPRSRVR